MSILRSLVKAPMTPVLKRNARKKLSGLEAEKNSALASVYRAIEETLDNKLSEEEATWIDHLQTLRNDLEADNTDIAILDFGAGKRDAQTDAGDPPQQQVRQERTGDLCKATAKPRFWALMLFKLIRTLRPTSCLEMGTCLGLSAMHQAAALKLNGKGRLTTMEGAPEVAARARKNIDAFDLDNIEIVVGSFAETLADTSAKCAPIDFAFVDGHHEEHATVNYFETLLEKIDNPAVIVFDDISWSPGMQRAWKTIAQHDSVKAAINLRAVGIAIIDQKMKKQEPISLPLI